MFVGIPAVLMAISLVFVTPLGWIVLAITVAGIEMTVGRSLFGDDDAYSPRRLNCRSAGRRLPPMPQRVRTVGHRSNPFARSVAPPMDDACRRLR